MNKIQKRNTVYKNGFSLIETLVAVVLIGSIGLIASTSLFNLLAGSAKTETTKEIKQNGDYAISNMEQNIRNALDAYYFNGSNPVCDGTAYNSLTIVQPSQTILYECLVSGSLNKFQITTTAKVAAGPSPTPAISDLSSNSVNVSVCPVFSCDDTGEYKVVTVNFTLQDTQNMNSQTYNTQIRLRNK